MLNTKEIEYLQSFLRPLLSHMRAYLKVPVPLDDLEQEMLLKLIEMASEGKHIPTKEYMATMAKNLCLDQKRAHVGYIDIESLPEGMTDSSECENSEWLGEAMSYLTEEEQQFLALRLAGWTMEALAEEYDTTVSAIQRKQRKLVETLRTYT